MNEFEFRRLRARILRNAATEGERPYPSRWALGAACLLIALLSLAIVRSVSRGTTVPGVEPDGHGTLAGTVAPAPGAQWSQVRALSVEHVALRFGTLTIHVRHQSGAERFIVLVPDGELEVRGTTFEVSATSTSTRRVHVDEGIVVLRLRHRDEVVLEANRTWEPEEGPHELPSASAVAAPPLPTDPEITSSAPAASARVPMLPGRAGSVVPPGASSTPSAREDGVSEYATAIALLGGRKFAQAADAFRDFVEAHPLAPQAEDASFLEATALAREGRTDAAGRAAERHLQSFPASFHRKDAAILVARAARDRGDCPSARDALAPWLAEADSEAIAVVKRCAATAPQ